MSLEKIIARLSAYEALIPAVAAEAAPLVEARLRADATTRRGNVPAFAPGANGRPTSTIPIRATADANSITVSAPDWVMAKAIDKNQPAIWLEIVADVTAELVEAHR